MLFILISILVLSFVVLYYMQENINIVKLFKKFTVSSAKPTKSKRSKQAISNKELEEVHDNVLDFNAFKEAHQKQ